MELELWMSLFPVSAAIGGWVWKLSAQLSKLTQWKEDHNSESGEIRSSLKDMNTKLTELIGYLRGSGVIENGHKDR